MSIEATFLRDLNRAKDADRNTRKRGLQKLLESLPWDKKSQREELIAFLSNHVLSTTLGCINDPIEKCREFSLRIVLNTLKVWQGVPDEIVQDLVQRCCSRIDDIPFPEPAEELRLIVVEILQQLIKLLSKSSTGNRALFERILVTMCKALHDSFPNVKRSCAEIICSITIIDPTAVRMHGKALLKGLTANATHQHAKTRILSLEAIAKTLCCLSLTSYRELMKETILAIFYKAVSDRTAVARVDLANIIGHLVDFRIGQCSAIRRSLLDVDMECIVILLLLVADSTEGVSVAGRTALQFAFKNYNSHTIPRIQEGDNLVDEDLVDGEEAMRAIPIEEIDVEMAESSNAGSIAAEQLDVPVHSVLALYLTDIIPLLLQGTDNWTVEYKLRYLVGLEKYLAMIQGEMVPALAAILTALIVHVRDDELEVRKAAESCCQVIGHYLPAKDWQEVILPRILGRVAGGDTAPQRAGALRVCSNLWKGRGLEWNSSRSASDSIDEVAGMEVPAMQECVDALVSKGLLSYRDVAVREALVLMARAMIEVIPSIIWSLHPSLQERLVLVLVFLSGKGPMEDDIVSDVARKELNRLATFLAGNATAAGGAISLAEELINKHFLYCYQSIVFGDVASQSIEEIAHRLNSGYHTQWDAPHPSRIAFTELLHACSIRGWSYHTILLPILHFHCQPSTGPAPGSMEANLQSYASQRGEEVIPAHRGEIDVRLALLAALEGFLRAGIAHWECGPHIASAALYILQKILIPNLIWRIGRVEATIRKVALAAAFNLLKAGAIPFESLFQIATELVPLLVSNLDDMEVSPRLMAALGLTVVFDRLKGVFSDQSVQEIYPKLIARLDDSNDEVRGAICKTLSAFFQCAVNRECYHRTMVDYCLDQLFIHLDDPQPVIQEAVYPVILRVAEAIDREAVIKKAQAQRMAHRSPTLCDRILAELK